MWAGPPCRGQPPGDVARAPPSRRSLPAAPRPSPPAGRRWPGRISIAPDTIRLPPRVRTRGNRGAALMRVVALYNMKGGVGKTTTAVNLSYLAAAAGQRTLVWDLDPQAASSFAFRVRPRVAGFGRKSLARGEALAAAIKETDYGNLDLLPADFAYRRLDRMLGRFGKPDRIR